VLAFPCNQFGAQEPGTDAEIFEFAQSRYEVDFPMFSKIEVNGDGAAPVYRFLKGEGPDLSWNFAKFLVGRDGQVLKRYSPQVTPEEIGSELSALLK
jgi:glutathione peroxidase